jgi:hypothetical protein
MRCAQGVILFGRNFIATETKLRISDAFQSKERKLNKMLLSLVSFWAILR